MEHRASKSTRESPKSEGRRAPATPIDPEDVLARLREQDQRGRVPDEMQEALG